MTRLGFLVLVGLAACTGADDTNGRGNGTNWGSNGGGGSGSGTCSDIVGCTNSCQTQSCIDACMDRGTPEAQEQLLDLSECIQTSQCADWSCIATECADPYDACLGPAGGSGGGGGGGGGGPQGTPLPSEIVGEWSSADYRTIISYTFTADGHASGHAILATGFDGCQSKWATSFVGVAQWGANSMLTIQSTSGSQTNFDCAGNETSTSPWSTTEEYRVEIGADADGPLLYLTDLAIDNTVTYHKQ